MKNIVILGSTGSIGTQTIDILDSIEAHVCAISVNTNIARAEEQARALHPSLVAVYNEEKAKELKTKLADTDIRVVSGMDGLIEAATLPEAEVVVTAVVGMVGLLPTMAAIEAGKAIALANKETLVCAGQIVMRAAREKGVPILPVDSEHSAIFQCLQGAAGNRINRILLTASGGPFFGMSQEQMRHVTKEQALHHPNWSMGAKITIDSATMMNKGLEVIEAKWLFNVPASKIQVLVHPQSIVHSGVEFMDNSVIAQMGIPDMRIPISLALGYPDRLVSDDRELDFFSEGSNLTFEKPDMEVFSCMKYAYEAIEAGGSYPIALNAANEVLVAAFLAGKIGFLDIPETIKRVLDAHEAEYNLDLEGILRVDGQVRADVESLLDMADRR